ncbi:MAG: hypothetical protein K2K82_09950 [Muribaculaceae bacterium]|nr:hypothetical protein [Muribaculaceae bacterium]
MIKKVYFALAIGAIASLTSCDSKSTSNAEDQDGEKTEQTEATETAKEDAAPVIEQNEEQVRSEVGAMYANTEMWHPDMLTPEFRADIEAADKKAQATGDEMGWIECDIFTLSQDPGKYGDVQDITLNNDGTATVKVVNGTFGSEGYVIVTAKLIDGTYYIDDIADVNMGSVRTIAQNYCK